MLSTLFASRGTIMLTAGDEFGRTQHGNNNAYAQDNEITWLDWESRDRELEDHVAAIAAFRKRWRVHGDSRFLDGATVTAGGLADVEWLSESGHPLQEHEWSQPDRHRLTDGAGIAGRRRADRDCRQRRPPRRSVFTVPARAGSVLGPAAGTERDIQRQLEGSDADRRPFGGLSARRAQLRRRSA